MKISIDPYELQIESFEEYRAAGYAVEWMYGEDHELTQHLRTVGREHFDYRNGKFTPEVVESGEATLVLNALWKLSRSSNQFAPSAAFMIEHSDVFAGPLERVAVTDPVPAFRDPPVRSK